MRHIVSLAALVVATSACDSTLENNGSMSGEVELPPLASDGTPDQPSPSGEAGEPSGLPGVVLNGTPVRSRLVRLNHAQWEHSVRDVLRLDEDPGLSLTFTGER